MFVRACARVCEGVRFCACYLLLSSHAAEAKCSSHNFRVTGLFMRISRVTVRPCSFSTRSSPMASSPAPCAATVVVCLLVGLFIVFCCLLNFLCSCSEKIAQFSTLDWQKSLLLLVLGTGVTIQSSFYLKK